MLVERGRGRTGGRGLRIEAEGFEDSVDFCILVYIFLSVRLMSE
jgi:hypothetical protein